MFPLKNAALQRFLIRKCSWNLVECSPELCSGGAQVLHEIAKSEADLDDLTHEPQRLMSFTSGLENDRRKALNRAAEDWNVRQRSITQG